MKYKIQYYLFILLFSVPFLGNARSGEVIPDYSVTKTSLDKSLKKGEALFVFTCNDASITNRKKSFKSSYNGITMSASPDAKGKFSLLVKPGKYLFQFYFNLEYNEIETDSILIQEKYKTEITLYFTKAEEMRPMKKPVLYFYPEKEMSINVQLDVKGELGFTYPAYDKGWEFKANPNGDLSFGDKTYPYLFWEGAAALKTQSMNLEQGFIVSSDSLISFFENKLKLMGFTSKESTDFITYWCPLMNKHKQCYVHFLFAPEIEKYASLTIEPKPDNLFRVFMIWSPIEKNKTMHAVEQTIPNFKRNGFTVLEWGGTETSIFTEL